MFGFRETSLMNLLGFHIFFSYALSQEAICGNQIPTWPKEIDFWDKSSRTTFVFEYGVCQQSLIVIFTEETLENTLELRRLIGKRKTEN